MVYGITIRLTGMKALTDSDCTRTHLRGPKIEKIFLGGEWRGHAPRPSYSWSLLMHTLTHTPPATLAPPSSSVLEPPPVTTGKNIDLSIA